MEWILTVAIAFVVGALIGQKLKRQRTELRQRTSLRALEKVEVGNKTSPKRVFGVKDLIGIPQMDTKYLQKRGHQWWVRVTAYKAAKNKFPAYVTG